MPKVSTIWLRAFKCLPDPERRTRRSNTFRYAMVKPGQHPSQHGLGQPTHALSTSYCHVTMLEHRETTIWVKFFYHEPTMFLSTTARSLALSHPTAQSGRHTSMLAHSVGTPEAEKGVIGGRDPHMSRNANGPQEEPARVTKGANPSTMHKGNNRPPPLAKPSDCGSMTQEENEG